MNPKHALFAESSAELLYRDLILSDVGPGDSKPASGSLQRSLTGRGRSQRRSQSQVNLETNFLLVTFLLPREKLRRVRLDVVDATLRTNKLILPNIKE